MAAPPPPKTADIGLPMNSIGLYSGQVSVIYPHFRCIATLHRRRRPRISWFSLYLFLYDTHILMSTGLTLYSLDRWTWCSAAGISFLSCLLGFRFYLFVASIVLPHSCPYSRCSPKSCSILHECPQSSLLFFRRVWYHTDAAA